MCPLRLILMLLAAIGLANFMGPMALTGASKTPGSEGNQANARGNRRIWLWLGTFVIFALHTDLLLSLGYTKCAFHVVSGIHQYLFRP